MTALMPGSATKESTERYAKRFSSAAPGHFRPALGVTLGSVGMGTYLGNPDVETDEAYAESAAEAVEQGCNVIDTAANYRFQRSERSIGAALQRLAAKGFSREEIVICTKAGYIPFDAEVPANPPDYFTETFIKPGIASTRDLVSGMHCMTPKYLTHQLDCSRKNLGVEKIDVYYLHNPEEQLNVLSRDEFHSRIRQAFEFLESAVSDGKIGCYGCATWNAFRQPPDARDHISLSRLVQIAREIAGDRHHFAVIQLPYNLALPEALLAPTQDLDGKQVPALAAAAKFGLTVFTSVPIYQGHLLPRLPAEIQKLIPNLTTNAQRAIQFVRSTPNVTAPLVGMSSKSHVLENLALLKVPPLTESQFSALSR